MSKPYASKFSVRCRLQLRYNEQGRSTHRQPLHHSSYGRPAAPSDTVAGQHRPVRRLLLQFYTLDSACDPQPYGHSACCPPEAQLQPRLLDADERCTDVRTTRREAGLSWCASSGVRSRRRCSVRAHDVWSTSGRSWSANSRPCGK